MSFSRKRSCGKPYMQAALTCKLQKFPGRAYMQAAPPYMRAAPPYMQAAQLFSGGYRFSLDYGGGLEYNSKISYREINQRSDQRHGKTPRRTQRRPAVRSGTH